MIAHDLALGCAEHARGVVVSQVYLFRERQLCDIGKALDVARFHACLIELSPVEGRVIVDVADYGLEPILLKGMQILDGHALNMWIPVTGH
jgi:hypothetical protein